MFDLAAVIDSRSLLLLVLAVVAVPLLVVWDALKNDHKSDLGSYLRKLMCDRGWHRRRAETVRRATTGYTARCRGCGVRLYRDTRKAPWRIKARDVDVPTTGS